MGRGRLLTPGGYPQPRLDLHLQSLRASPALQPKRTSSPTGNGELGRIARARFPRRAVPERTAPVVCRDKRLSSLEEGCQVPQSQSEVDWGYYR